MSDVMLQQRIRKHSVPQASGCWLWNAGGRGVGYGAIKVAGRVIDAHRASYVAFNGQIPDGQVVMHACDNRRCVNPEHLRLGTKQDNARDAVTKGRVKPFRPHRDQPLTTAERQAIVDDWNSGLSERVLVVKYNIPATSLKRVLGTLKSEKATA